MTSRTKGGAFFPVLFLAISALFIGILGVAYGYTRHATIVMLDEKGQPQANR